MPLGRIQVPTVDQVNPNGSQSLDPNLGSQITSTLTSDLQVTSGRDLRVSLWSSWEVCELDQEK